VAVHRTQRLEDPGAELIARASTWWTQYGRVAAIAIGIVAAAAVLVAFGLRTRANSEDQAANKLADANLLFWQGDYKRSQDVAKQIAQQWPGTPSGIDAHRLAGDDAYWTGDFKGAITEYRAYLDRNKNGLLADAVRRSLAYSLENDKQYPEAIRLYVGLVGKFDRESSGEFLDAAARCERAAGHNAEALKYLQRLTEEFGETSHAASARVALGELSSGAK